MSKILVGLFSILALLSGCATGAPRTIALQTKPTAYAAARPIQVSAIQIEIADQRSDRSLDPILAKRASDAAADAIRAALLASKLAVIEPGATQVLEVRGALGKLEWLVPGYQAMLKKVFATSFLTGGIGGLAYGSTSTPVEGHASLQIAVSREGREILQREYIGTHQETTVKLKCDTMETKSRVAGSALSAAIDKLLADLDAVAKAANDAPKAPDPAH
jgi:hypothetical protein